MNNILQEIKYIRLKPEEKYLIDILTKIEIVNCSNYPDSEFYELNDEILFEQDSKNDYFWVNYVKIWSVLESKYGLNDQEISILIKDTVWKTLKRKVSTPRQYTARRLPRVWKTLKRKVSTPWGFQMWLSLRCGKPLKER